MKVYIATNILGSFAFDEKGKLLGYRFFEKNSEVIAKKLESEGVLEEEKELIFSLSKKHYKEFVSDKKMSLPGISCIHQPDNTGKKTLQENFRKFALDLKWVSSNAELNEMLAKVNVLLTKTKMKEQGRDRVLMRVVGIIDELDKEINVFSERLKEWYGLYFPEKVKEIKSNEKLVETIARSNFSELKDIAKKFSGIDFSENDIKTVSLFSESLLSLFKIREELAKYLEEEAKKTIPNMCAIATPLLASRLLALSGGLEKIAKLPSSTIQLLGAEKALFRHLRDKTRAPKFGVLFAHPYVQNAQKEKKGKVARLIAAKLAIAARIDYFSKEDKSEGLKKELEEQVKALK